jgi:ATP-dependent helicase/nuclease subunit A
VAGQVIAGTVDRLLVTDDLVHIVDFKTGRRVPTGLDDIPTTHVKQMAAYAAAMAEIFPGKRQRVSLLYTAGPRLVDIPSAMMEAHKPRLEAAQDKLGSSGLEAEARAT